jgi:GTP-binding protein YchF
MGFTCGIVGLPNVGKSTLFNALAASQAEVANYPFCTIEPNRGVVAVPDPRLEKLARLLKPEKVTPTTLEFHDVAGLVKGAHQGEGLGNQFLAHIRRVDAIAHVIRAFADENVSHVFAELDPVRDAEIVNTELLLADLEQVQRRLDKLRKLARVGDKEAKADLPGLERLDQALSSGTAVHRLALDEDGQEVVRELALLTAKPMIYVANLDEGVPQEAGAALAPLEELAASTGAQVVGLSAQVESEIVQLEDPEEREAFYEELGLSEPGLHRVIRAGYALIDLITFYTTVGPELRAWTVKRGTAAPQAAGKIHTDFEKGFIRAEVIHWDDFDRLGDERAVREAGLLHLEGRDYVVQDSDVIRFRFNV